MIILHADIWQARVCLPEIMCLVVGLVIRSSSKLSVVDNHSHWAMGFRCRVTMSVKVWQMRLISMEGKNTGFSGSSMAKFCRRLIQ